jgi:hypothetical protein
VTLRVEPLHPRARKANRQTRSCVADPSSRLGLRKIEACQGNQMHRLQSERNIGEAKSAEAVERD